MDTQPAESSDKIQLRIDDFTTRKINLFTAAVTLLTGLVFLVAISAPNAIAESDRSFADCDNLIYTQVGYDCTDYNNVRKNTYFNIRIPERDLSPSNRFLMINMQPLTFLKDQSKTVSADVEVSAILTAGDGPKVIIDKQKQTLTYSCSADEREPCDCQEVVVIDKIEKGSYYFIVKFLDTAGLNTDVDNFEAHSSTWSLSYAIYKFIVKGILVLLTFAGFFWYSRNLKELKKAFHCREQKLIKFIIPILITVNEPLTYHLFSGFMYVTFTVAQVFASSAVLLWLWLPFIDDIAGSESSVIEKSSKFSKFYVAAYAVSGVLTYIIYCNMAVHDPVHFFNYAPGPIYNVFKYLFIAVLLVGFGWIAWKTVSIVRRLDELTQRESTFFCFSSVFIVCQFYLVARGGADPFSYDGTRLILYDGLTTLYVFAAAYLFCPTEEGVAQANHKQKYDNPVANAAYKDLDESDVPPKKPEIQSSVPADLERGVSAASGTSEQPLEKKYPYEAQHDDM